VVVTIEIATTVSNCMLQQLLKLGLPSTKRLQLKQNTSSKLKFSLSLPAAILKK